MDKETKVPKKVARSDFLLLILVLGLITFGVIMVFSASYYSTITQNNGPYAYLIRSAVWAGAGIALFIVLRYVPYKIYYYLAPIALIVGFILLILLFTPLGDYNPSARRWLKIGPVTLMPGEIIKICLIFFVAAFYTKYRYKVRSLIYGYLPIFLIVLICFFLIFMQPNLSTAIIVFGIVIGMIYFAGANGWHILFSGGLALLCLVFMLLSRPNSYQVKRITGYLNPFEDAQGDFYQLVQSLLALGSGGVFGVGPGNSVQKALYLPEAQNDFIFAIIGEEYGFVGCVALIMVFLVLIWRCAIVSLNAPDRFGKLLGAGITLMIGLQVTINIAIVTGLLPPTGVTLPFISYGGNAMLLFAGSMGIIMNISYQSTKPAVKIKEDKGEEEKPKKKKKKIVRRSKQSNRKYEAV